MPKNVMKMLKPSPTLGRNAFDMSQRVVNACNFGDLLPCYCLETVPHDKIVIRPANLVRAMPMQTSPFMRAKQHIDFWFVPYSQLWSRWNDFITSRSEPTSAALKAFDKIPTFNLYELLAGIDASSQVNVLGTSFKDDAFRLLDALGYPSYQYFFNYLKPSPDNLPVCRVNPWRLAAYQKIWYTEYRQKYYDDGRIGFHNPSPGVEDPTAFLFNFDDLDCSSDLTSDILVRSSVQSGGAQWFDYACQLRKRCWKKDLFSGLMPSTQLGAVSTVNFISDTATSLRSSNPLNDIVFVNPGTGKLAMNEVTYSSTGTSFGLYGNFDILSLRRSMAVQKWRENALRAGSMIEDNYEAHFGVKPKSHMDSHPILIGSYDAPLNIGDVEATALSPIGSGLNANVGDVAGKGISSQSGHELHFQTNDFGVVMGIFSMLPEAEYQSSGVDRMNQLVEQFDYFFPEMENLGLEAVDPATLDVRFLGSAAMGYAPRYFGYKQKVDTCHLQFFNHGTGAQGLYRNWCSPKSAWNSYNAMLRSLYVDHNIFNVNFNVSADGTHPQFILDSFMDVTAIRPLSVTGMPGY